MAGLKIKCDQCGKTFHLEQKSIKVKKIGGGIEIVWFPCPKCGVEYKVAETDERIREIHRLLKTATFEEGIPLRLELKERMDALNKHE